MTRLINLNNVTDIETGVDYIRIYFVGVEENYRTIKGYDVEKLIEAIKYAYKTGKTIIEL